MNNIFIERLDLDTEKGKEEIAAAKAFMLKIIKDDFGYDFNPKWHDDIVRLEEVYMPDTRSCVYVAKLDNEIIGTIALRPYDKKYPEFMERYDGAGTASIWRHYIAREYRGQGIGTELLCAAEEFAQSMGYKTIYLHTQKTIPGSLEYWQAKGYIKVLEAEDDLQTVHLEKSI